MELKDAEEKAVRAEGTQKSLVLKSRVLVQRACNHSAVEVYRYDADGTLKAAETDITTWEERNTEIYGWLNTDPPPFEPRQPVNRFRRDVINSAPTKNDPTHVGDYENLLDQMTSQVHKVPALKSSTVVVSEQQTATNRQPPKTVLHSNSTRVDGLRRSHSEHCITYKSSVQTASDVDRKQPAIPATSAPAQKGRQIWTPTAPSSTTPWLTGTGSKKPGFVKPSPVGTRAGTDFGTAFIENSNITSLAERQRKRCLENRMRKAAGKFSNHLQQQQQHIQHARQWRHVEYGKNY